MTTINEFSQAFGQGQRSTLFQVRGEIPGSSTNQTEWSLTVVQDADNRIREDFIGWMNQLNSHENITGATPGPALFPTWTIEALQQDDSISGGQGIQLTNCFPTEVGTLEFNYETVDTFAEFTVTLQYDYWTSKKSND